MKSLTTWGDGRDVRKFVEGETTLRTIFTADRERYVKGSRERELAYHFSEVLECRQEEIDLSRFMKMDFTDMLLTLAKVDKR